MRFSKSLILLLFLPDNRAHCETTHVHTNG